MGGLIAQQERRTNSLVIALLIVVVVIAGGGIALVAMHTGGTTSHYQATFGVPCSQNPACSESGSSGSATSANVTGSQAFQDGEAHGRTAISGMISGGPSEQSVCYNYVPNQYQSAGLGAEWQNGCAAGYASGSANNAQPTTGNVQPYSGGAYSGGASGVQPYSGGSYSGSVDGSSGGFSGAP